MQFDTLADDLGFTEGPTIGRSGALYVTSISRGLVYRIAAGEAQQFAVTGGGANGLTEGRDGFFVAQNGGTWPAENNVKASAGVQVIRPGGVVRALADGAGKGGMKSPNDLAFGPDGYLYVTDPTRKPERDDGRIWRVNPSTGEAELLLTLDWYPNGIGFSVEDDCYYVADTRNARIVRFPLIGATPAKGEPVIQMRHNHPDGFAFDLEGNIVIACPGTETTAGDIQVWTLSGKLLQSIAPGSSRYYTNLAIGSDARIYITDSDGGRVLSGTWPSPGLGLHPFRPA